MIPHGRTVRRRGRLAAAALALGLAASAAWGVPEPQEDGSAPAIAGLGTPKPIHPPIALAVGAATPEEQRACIEHNAMAGNQCSFSGIVPEALMATLMQTDRFAGLSLRPAETPYALTLASTNYLAEDLGSVLGGAAAGASLNLFPVKQKRLVRIRAELRWQGLPLRALDYELPLVARTQLLRHNDGLEALHQQFAEALVADIDAEGLLTPEFLYAALDASDYERDLTVPDEIAGLPNRGRRLFADPFLGVGVAYGEEGSAGRVNVYVYPITKVHWFDERALLVQEARKAVAEMRAFAEYEGTALDPVDEPEIRAVETGDGSVAVAVATADVTRSDGLRSRTALHLFTRGDKLVKVRATDAGELPLATLIDAIAVPGESEFMAVLRTGARERVQRAPAHETFVE